MISLFLLRAHFGFVKLFRQSFQPVRFGPHDDAVPLGEPEDENGNGQNNHKDDGFNHRTLLDDEVLVFVLVCVLRPGNGTDASAAGHNVQTPFFRQPQNDQNRNDGEDEKDGFPHGVTSCDGMLPPKDKHHAPAWQTAPFPKPPRPSSRQDHVALSLRHEAGLYGKG